MGEVVSEGVFGRGLPYLAVGDGPPMVVLRGLSGENANPTGFERWMELQMVRPLSASLRVHVLGLRPGLSPGTSMRELADDVADAIRATFGGAVPVEGISTGGSVALQLAIDHPDTVHRLAVVAAASRLGDTGRAAQRRLAELTEAGRPRDAWAALGPPSAATSVGGRLMAALMWLAASSMAPDDPSDMLATIRAEDGFDVSDDLHRITAPTLVVAGGRDRFYDGHLFHETVRRIPDGTLLMYPTKGHAGVVSHRPAQREVARFLTGDRLERRS